VPPLTVTGPALVLRHLVDLAAVTVLLAVCAAVGLQALAWLRVRYEAPLESLLFGLGIGSGVVATTLLVMGLAGALGGRAPELTVLIFGVIAARQLAALPSYLRGALRSLIGTGGPADFTVLAITAAAASFVLLLAIAPVTDWDSLTYHLRVPAQFLERGRIFLPEDNLHVAFVGLPHMLYLPLLRVGSSSAPAVLSAALTIAFGLTTFALASRFWGRACGLVSLALLWSSPVILLVGGTPRIDVTVGLFLLLAHYALLLALRTDSGTGHVYVGGLLAGFALGGKYHALLYDAALAPLAFAAARANAASLKQAASKAAVASGLAAAAAAPYLLKNLLLLGAPLYPFFVRPALEPWLVPVLQSATVPLGAGAGAFHALADVRRHFNLVDAFLHPGRLTVESEGQFYYASPVFVMLLLWPMVRRDRVLNWLGLPAVAYLVVLLWAFPATNLRYLVPALAPLSIVAVVIATEVASRLRFRPALRLVVPLLGGVALGPSAAAAAGWLSGTPLFSHAVGLTSDSLYLATPRFSDHWRVVRYVNDSLPRNARVLAFFEARAYAMNRSVLADPRLTNWPLLAETRAPDDCLQSLGITHVLVGHGSIGYYLSRGLDPAALRLDAFDRFVARCLEPIFAVSGATVYRLAPPSAAGI
jgi:hypothetical protein